NNNILQNITANNNRGVSYGRGLDLYVSHNNTFQSITANNNPYGFYISSSWYNNLSSITANNNSQYGLYIVSSKKNTLSSSTLISNAYGVYLYSNSPNNTIFNNYFNNTINAHDTGINYWNITKTRGKNIMGGPYLGGNFWHDYNGTDTNWDGIGDTNLPYNSNRNIQNGGDYLPLVVLKPRISSR
ncbi:MAG: NosD domain-containing protein, partial [Nanoarchaeota archaeon]